MEVLRPFPGHVRIDIQLYNLSPHYERTGCYPFKKANS